MQQQTVPVNPNASVLVHAVQGDLRVAGWERNELMAKTSGSTAGPGLRHNPHHGLLRRGPDPVPAARRQPESGTGQR